MPRLDNGFLTRGDGLDLPGVIVLRERLLLLVTRLLLMLGGDIRTLGGEVSLDAAGIPREVPTWLREV